MKTNNNKSSARKKLVPAVAMLTASAVMLSTATYAWFTMNKEVEVTGLTMSATASDGLEISLGEINGTTPTNEAPKYDSASWKRAIAIDDYYSAVGKLMPASSDTGLTMYKVDEEKVFGGGTKVEDDADVTDPKLGGSATLTLDTAEGGSANTYHVITDDANAQGYFIDVPMWIRASNSAENKTVYCTVTVTDPEASVVTGATNTGSELMNSVRVAIIPIGTATSTFDGTTDGIKGLTLTGSAGYEASSITTSKLTLTSNTTVLGSLAAAKIFGLEDETYNGKVLSSEAAYSTACVGTQTVQTSYTVGTFTKDISPNTAVFTIPQAGANNYSGVSFIARVWIEGESTYCNDATADQDWNIDFHFSLDNVPTPTSP
ncbi:MAG: hypothetical protein ACI4JW_08805 [Oscillospiraceae bacterium]